MKETLLKNIILDYLKYKNIFCWLTNTAGNFSIKTNSYYKNPRLLKGVGDIVGIMPSGKFFCVECKVSKNKQSPEQKEFQTNIVKNKGIYILAYSLEDVEFVFKKFALLEPYKTIA